MLVLIKPCSRVNDMSWRLKIALGCFKTRKGKERFIKSCFYVTSNAVKAAAALDI